MLSSTDRKKRRLPAIVRRILIAAVYSAVALACFLAINSALGPGGWPSVLPALATLPVSAILLALLWVVAAHAALLVLDHQAVLDGSSTTPFHALRLYAANVLSLGAGFGALSGSALRIRLYAPLGVDVATAIYASVATTTMLMLGGLLVAAFGTLAGRLDVTAVGGAIALVATWIAGISLGAAVVLVLFATPGGRELKLGRRRLNLPSSAKLTARLTLAAFNWIASGIGLYVLLPDAARPDLLEWITTISALRLISLLTGSPGGLGVFEAMVLSLASHDIAAEILAAALLAHRFISFILPVALAAATAAFLEINAERVANHRPAASPPQE